MITYVPFLIVDFFFFIYFCYLLLFCLCLGSDVQSHFCKNEKTQQKRNQLETDQGETNEVVFLHMHVYIGIYANRFIHVPDSCLLHTCCDSILPSSSRRHKQKTLTWWKYKPCAKTTWVPADLIPTEVKQKLVKGVAKSGKLQHVMMSKRVVVGPSRAHEQLRTTNHITSLFSTSNDGQPLDHGNSPHTLTMSAVRIHTSGAGSIRTLSVIRLSIRYPATISLSIHQSNRSESIRNPTAIRLLMSHPNRSQLTLVSVITPSQMVLILRSPQ